MQFDTDDTIQQLREQVSRFVDDRVTPIADKIDKTDEFPRHLWPQFGELGLLGITVDEAYGGAGLGYLAHSIVCEEIARGSASVSLSYGAHSNLCVNQLSLNGTHEQKQQYLPKLIAGEHVGALAMSEHNAGSDVVSMQLRAEKRGDRFVLNGSKMWITNGPEANTFIVYAKTDPDKGAHGITAFIIEREFNGFSTGKKLDKLGHRGSPTCELIFEDCEVPEENVLGQINGGVAVLMSGLDYERTVLAGCSVGIMRNALELSLDYAKQRKQFGKSIGEFQLIQGKLADMYAATNSARAYLYAVATACDRGETTRQDAAACLLTCGEKAVQISLEAVQIFGGNGYINEYPVGRLLRDAKLHEIGGGTNEVRRLLIGRELMASI